MSSTRSTFLADRFERPGRRRVVGLAEALYSDSPAPRNGRGASTWNVPLRVPARRLRQDPARARGVPRRARRRAPSAVRLLHRPLADRIALLAPAVAKSQPITSCATGGARARRAARFHEPDAFARLEARSRTRTGRRVALRELIIDEGRISARPGATRCCGCCARRARCGGSKTRCRPLRPRAVALPGGSADERAEIPQPSGSCVDAPAAAACPNARSAAGARRRVENLGLEHPDELVERRSVRFTRAIGLAFARDDRER